MNLPGAECLPLVVFTLVVIALVGWCWSCWSAERHIAVVQTTDRGKILIARKPYPRGSIITCDRALLSVSTGMVPLESLARLGGRERRLMLALHCPEALSPSRPEDGGRSLSETFGEHGESLEAVMVRSGWSATRAALWKDEAWRLLRIWDANKLSFSSPKGFEQCVFPTLSRMNHSCVPNVRLVPGGAQGELVALAAVDISAGEELNTCYSERNALPLLHFLHLPTASRQHLLLRWGFQCGCQRCSALEERSRVFRCPASRSGCEGQVSVCGSAFSCCDTCCGGVDLETESAIFKTERELQHEAERCLAPLLRTALEPAHFPMAEVLELLGRCSEAGLVLGHWLVFWLVCLVGVGGSGRDLQLAAQGVSRAPVLLIMPGLLPELALQAPLAARAVLLEADKAISAGSVRRPGLTPGVAAYFAFL